MEARPRVTVVAKMMPIPITSPIPEAGEVKREENQLPSTGAVSISLGQSDFGRRGFGLGKGGDREFV